MTPAARFPVEPGERVLDLCAAPGGKATALGAALQGKGVLVANDISNSRAKTLLKNLEVFGISNAFVTNEVPQNLAERFEGFFDKVLIDAPCSGEGMFRKDPAVIKTWEEERPEYFAKLQKDILKNGVRMLRPGGKLLYSTCTFAPEEDEQVIRFLLEACPEDSFHFMTPFGYVDLNAQDAERLWQGAAAQAHTGESGWEIPVPAEKLLQQELVSVRKAENGQWYAITTDPQPKMSESEQMQEMQL